MDLFRQMQALLAVVQSGSFVGGAQRLDTSKAVVSRLVQDLESQLGTRLLHRTTRRLSLTDAGSDYVERCRQILEDVEDANTVAGQGSSQVNGRLKINAPLTFGNLHLAPLWGEFLKLHPQVELDITLTDRMVDLVEEGYDMAVRITQSPSSSLIARTLSTDRMVMCAAPAYLQAAAPIHTLQEIAHHPVMAYSWWSGGDEWRFEDAQGQTQRVMTRPRLRANSGDTCRAAALAGQGIIYQPQFLVGDDLRTGRLQRLLPALQGPEIPIVVVYPSRKHLPGKVRAMVDFLVAAFQTPAWGFALSRAPKASKAANHSSS